MSETEPDTVKFARMFFETMRRTYADMPTTVVVSPEAYRTLTGQPEPLNIRRCSLVLDSDYKPKRGRNAK